jgi:hypothetical protein
LDLFDWVSVQSKHELQPKPEPEPATEPVKRNPSAAKPLPVDVIREALEIDETVPSGLRWKARPRNHFATESGWKIFNARNAGKPAGPRQDVSIYYQVEINGVKYLSHRLVWLLTYGTDPGSLHIDHICADLPLPNVASNLRLASQSQNCRNRKKRSDNSSSVPGVYWDKRLQKWKAQIVVNGKYIYLSLFTNLADAIAARRAAEEKYFGEFSYAASQNLQTA